MTDQSTIDPPEPLISGAQSLIRNGQMQSNMDAHHFQILNLDTSNLVIPGIPTQPPIAHNWFSSYDSGTHLFGLTQPAFIDLTGNLTTSQQQHITKLGTVTQGVWNGTQLLPAYVPKLNNITHPDTSLSMAFQRIVALADPVLDQDAVNYRTLIARALGPPNPKAAVMVATTAAVTFTGLPVIDGYQVIEGDRVLVKDQPASPPPGQIANGIYDAHNTLWIRSADADTGDELTHATTFVLGGDTQIGTTWLETETVPAHMDQPIKWALLTTTLSLNAGAGLDITGNTIFAVGTTDRIFVHAGGGSGIDIASTYAGQMSINTLGTIGVGVWEATPIEAQYGGTGVNNQGKHITLAGDFTTSLGLGAPIGSFLTFALAGSSFLTLPTLGTLATLNGNEVFSNKHISASQIDSGTMQITQGGTGATTAVAALHAILPDITGHAGQTLQNDGVNIFWA